MAQYTLTKVMWADVQHFSAKKTRWSGTRVAAFLSLWAITCLLVYALLSLRSWKYFSKPEVLLLSAGVSVVVTVAVAWRRERVDDSFKELFSLFEFTDEGVERTTANTTTKTLWAGFKSYFELAEYSFLEYQNGMVDVLPKASFATWEEFDAYRTLARSKLPDSTPNRSVGTLPPPAAQTPAADDERAGMK